MTQAVPPSGVFALDWAHIHIDGISGLGPNWLRVGSSWRWTGFATRLDGSANVLPLGRSPIQPDLRPRARAIAARLAGQDMPQERPDPDLVAPHRGLVVTDGIRLYVGRLAQVWGQWLAVFSDALPPKGQDLFVVAFDPALAAPVGPDTPQDVLCFAAETLIDTPNGPRPVDMLQAGDLVLTYDNGPKPVLWVGQSRLSGVALRRFSHLRPVRICAAALGTGAPTEDLLISPAHRVLLRGPRAQALFNQPEVLVAARDLVDGRAIRQDLALHGVGYVHLLLEEHQILFANGVPCESFHPDMASPEVLMSHRADLRALLHPNGYGDPARRCVTKAEAALLLH